MVLICYFFSTCVPEWKLCEGIPLCKNKADLKWCRSAPIATEAHWKDFPRHYSAKCVFGNQTDGRSPNGQWISPFGKDDKHTFHCSNQCGL